MPPLRTRPAFTLIELLVVISIIGVLAGMLMPALGTVREMARQTTCANKLRQIGIAHQGYQNDWEGGLCDRSPVTAPYSTAGAPEYCKLSEYLGYGQGDSPKPMDQSPLGKFLVCPKNPKGLFYGNVPSWPINTHTNTDADWPGNGRTYRLSEFTAPSAKIYAMDGCDVGQIRLKNSEFFNNPVAGNVSLRHKGTMVYYNAGSWQYVGGVANSLFLDGHIQALGGSVFPKLSNWSAANAWLAYNSAPASF